MLKFSQAILIAVLFLLNTVSLSLAQDSLTPVFTTNAPLVNFRWSEDGSVFTFQDAGFYGRRREPLRTEDLMGRPILGVPPTIQDWYAYRVPSNGLSDLASVDTWEQTNTVPDNVLDVPNLATNREGYIGFIFPSPDGRYVVYPSEPFTSNDTGYGWPLVILNTETGLIIPLDIYIVALENFRSYYLITWNRSSSSFTVKLNSGFGATLQFHVGNFADDPTAIQVQRLETFTIGDTSLYTLFSFTSLSSDGEVILMDGFVAVRDGRLIMWDVVQPENSRTIARGQDFIGAAFSLDETAVYYVGGSGLVRYDLATDEARVLNAEITSERFRYALFSPDMRHLALIEEDRTRHNYNSLYIISLTE